MNFPLVCWPLNHPPTVGGLWCDTLSKWVCLYPMLHYGCGSRIITLIIKFWQNSYLFKKKNIFLAQKLTQLEHFKENLLNASKKISQIQNINYWNIFGASLTILSYILNFFGFIRLWNDPFGSKCHTPMFQSPVCPPFPSLPPYKMETFLCSQAFFSEKRSTKDGNVSLTLPLILHSFCLLTILVLALHSCSAIICDNLLWFYCKDYSSFKDKIIQLFVL